MRMRFDLIFLMVLHYKVYNPLHRGSGDYLKIDKCHCILSANIEQEEVQASINDSDVLRLNVSTVGSLCEAIQSSAFCP